MNKKWLAAIGVALILVVGLVGCSPGEAGFTGGTLNIQGNLNSQQEGIWVNGEGKVVAVPDVAILNLGIEAQETSVNAAQSRAAEAMAEVMEALKAQGVAEKDIQTQYFNIQRVTRWDNEKQQEIVIGYRVTNVVTAKIREIEKTGAIIDAAAVAGGDLTRINGVSFTVDDPSAYYKEARTQAVTDAQAKAKQLADIAGVKLGKPTYISENAYTPGPIYRQDMLGKAAEASAPETPISPGEMEISISVQLVYAILG